VIGVDGRIPWNLPEDRVFFKDLTADKILVIGRKTFEEESNQCHISHVAQTIVVSRTLQSDDIDTSWQNSIHIARSFPEALHLANQLVEDSATASLQDSKEDDDEDIHCWVAGGERLYNEAVLHPSARCLHLTVVDKNLDTVDSDEIARFPAKYRWDNKFKPISNQQEKVADRGDVGLKFEHIVFERIRGRR
jgi:dihydrofolate reductase